VPSTDEDFIKQRNGPKAIVERQPQTSQTPLAGAAAGPIEQQIEPKSQPQELKSESMAGPVTSVETGTVDKNSTAIRGPDAKDVDHESNPPSAVLPASTASTVDEAALAAEMRDLLLQPSKPSEPAPQIKLPETIQPVLPQTTSIAESNSKATSQIPSAVAEDASQATSQAATTARNRHMAATAPPCPGPDLIANCVWFGYDDCTFCPKHWWSVVNDTGLVKDPSIVQELSQKPTLCALSSQGMREAWENASRAGSLDGFRSRARQRGQVAKRIVDQINFLGHRHQLLMAQANNAMMNKNAWVMADIAGSVKISSSSSQATSWDPMTAMYRTSEQLQGDQYERQYQALMNEGRQVSISMNQLMAEWKEAVER
jgi:hypothetical protein